MLIQHAPLSAVLRLPLRTRAQLHLTQTYLPALMAIGKMRAARQTSVQVRVQTLEPTPGQDTYQET